MLTKTTPIVVGFVRPHPRHSLSEQQRLMDARGITKVYTDFDLLVRQRRKGAEDVVAVKRLVLLADPSALRKAGGRRQSMIDAIARLESAGATILEIDSDRRMNDPKQREAALLDAIDELSRTRKGANKIGRPRKVWPDADLNTMRLHWFDHRIATNRLAGEAIRAAGVRATNAQIMREMGPSKRVAGNPDHRPVKTGFKRSSKSVVYFVQSGDDAGPIKIGVALDVRKRIASLQVSSYNKLTLLGTVPGDASIERQYHERFSRYRKSGEWFQCAGALAAFVTTLKKPKQT